MEWHWRKGYSNWGQNWWDTFGLTNVYAPNDDLTRTGFLKSQISDISTKITSPKLILGGDWNLALEKIDRKPHWESTSNSRRQIQEWIENFNLIDIWRAKNKSLERYTWSRNNPLSMSRIDFFLISSDTQRAYKSTSILESIRTDHKLVFLDLNVSVKPKRGPGFWKFNNSLLKDKNYTKLNRHGWVNTRIQLYHIGLRSVHSSLDFVAVIVTTFSNEHDLYRLLIDTMIKVKKNSFKCSC